MALAAQVVYTNVEQERSPHRRRGFQLWLWSKDLPKTVLDEVELRVNTFVRLTPADEASLREKKPPRRIFAPLVSGGWVMLAEAVPLKESDKFGRGGRFHTHALLFDRDEFLRFGADPFAVFDSGFAFQTNPEDRSLDGAVQARSLPTAEIEPQSRTTPPADDRFRALITTVVAAALDPAVNDTIALPIPVADADAVIRQVMRLLPPEARLRLSFDTLWTGKGKHVPRVAGAGTTALLQVWMFRRFVRFDPVREVVHPPQRAGERAVKLAGWWVDQPALEDADRRAGAAAVDWALDGPAHPPPVGLTANAAEWAARQFPQAVADRWAEAKAEVIAKALPPEAATLPGVTESADAYLGDWGTDGVERASVGIPAMECVRWVTDAVFASDHLDEPIARALYRWRANDRHPEGVKLTAALLRWLPEFLDYLCGRLADPSADDWLRDYCRRTLPPEYRDPDTAVDATHRHLCEHARPPAEAEIAEALAGADRWPIETADRLRLLLRAVRRLGGGADVFLRKRPALLEWAAERLLPTTTTGLPFVTLDLPEHSSNYWGKFFGPGVRHPLALLGLRVPPTAGPLTALFARHLRMNFLARLDPRFDTATYPTRPEQPADVDKRAEWKAIAAAHKQAKPAKLLAAVRQAGEDEFRKLADDHLLSHASGRWVCDELWDDGGLFAGVAVELSNPNDGGLAKLTLFALAGSVVPAANAGVESLPDADPRRLNRFAWLLARLLNPAHTTRLGMPPPDEPRRDAR